MKKCAILTMDNLEGFVVYDKMLDEPMNQCGWHVDHVSWRQPGVDWNQYDVAIIRSTWDYQSDVEAYMGVLKTISDSSALLLNSLSIVKWNINKNYLQEVQAKGAETVPTLWIEDFRYSDVESYFEKCASNQIVIKPTVSANADNTYWLKLNDYHQHENELQESLKGKQLMVQPFVESIVSVGEYSLFYFAGQYSHSIKKTPKSGDFRVQEEHGGLLASIEPDSAMLATAKKALLTIPEPVLYARIDLVEHQGQYKVMEIELIEPSLYFNLDDQSPMRFCKALNHWMDEFIS